MGVGEENLTDIVNSQEHLQSAALNTLSKFKYFKEVWICKQQGVWGPPAALGLDWAQLEGEGFG